jgi:hypothetical protein
LERAPAGEAQLDEAIQHRIPDRAAHLFREDDCGPRPAGGIPIGRQFYSRRSGRYMHRPDAVDFDRHAVDLDLNGDQGKKLPGAHRRDRQNSDRDRSRSEDFLRTNAINSKNL